MKNILCCTVGGSHQPIITAIKQLSPDHICFFCTTGKAGSDRQILGKGKVIKADSHDEKATLPNIPTQLNLSDDQFTVVEVPHDDLDIAYSIMIQNLKRISERWPDADLFADYTGGTKTMTAALVLAALDSKAELQAVLGQRTNLEKVADGTQWRFPASVERIRFEREMKQHLAAWQTFSYSQTRQGLERMEVPRQVELRNRFLAAKTLSEAFDAWDKFDHPKAGKLLSACRAEAGAIYGDYFKMLTALNGEKGKREPALLQDLWLNAKRRAHQGRFDDAVARVYRLIEGTAQWVLRRDCNVDSSDLPKEFIPCDVEIRKGHTGKYAAPLYLAWKLVEKRVKSPAADFMKEYGEDFKGNIGS